ncbi:MAG: glycosyltransferase [Candidatus Cloacimonadota bacterium]
MKKLLHVQALPLLTGVQNFSLHLLDGLPRDEYIQVLASAPGGDLVEACKDRGIRHIPIKHMKRSIGLWDIFALCQIIHAIRRDHFDIVHTNTSKAGFLGRLAARICRVPYIIHTSHGMPFQEGQAPAEYRLYRFLEGLGNKLCDTVVFVNDSDRIRSLKLGLVMPSKACTIYNAIPPQLQHKLAGIATQRSQTEGRSLKIGSTLRFSQQKNTVELVSALIKACNQDERLSFELLGEGENLELCRSMVRSHKLKDRILLPGWCPDVSQALARWDAFILYSRWEAMPFSIIEAMHSGLPVIGSDIPSICELVKPEHGYIAPLDNPEELVSLLCSLPDRKQELLEKGKLSRDYIVQKTDYKSMVENYLKLYRRGA